MSRVFVSIDCVRGIMRVYNRKRKLDTVNIAGWAETSPKDRGLDPTAVETWRASYEKVSFDDPNNFPDGTRTAIAA